MKTKATNEKLNNIIGEIRQDENSYVFEFFGINDIATGWDADILITYYDEILSYYESKNAIIETKNDFIDYLFLDKFKEFQPHIDKIVESKREQFANIVDKLCEKFKTYANKDLITYVNNNLENLFESSKFNIVGKAIDIAIKFHTGCIKSLEYVCNEKLPYILYKFSSMCKYINDYPQLLQSITATRQFEQIKYGNLKEYLQIVKFVKIKYNYVIDELVESINIYGKEVYESITVENVIENEHIIKTIMQFFRDVKSGYYNDYKKMMDEVAEKISQNLDKYGQQFSCEMPIDELLKPFNDPNIGWQIKLLYLTHQRTADNNFITNHVNAVNTAQDTLMDHICTFNIPIDEYFTMSRQNNLDMYDQIYLTLLAKQYVNNEKIEEFITMFYTQTEYVLKFFDIDDSIELRKEFDIMLHMMAVLIKYNESESIKSGLNFALTSFVCGLIEKLLRQIYEQKNKNIFIERKGYTLGNALNQSNEIMKELFGEDNIRIWAYYLIKGDNIDEVGRNIRNNYAHYKNLKVCNLTDYDALKAVQIYLMMVNELYIYISKKNSNGENSNG